VQLGVLAEVTTAGFANATGCMTIGGAGGGFDKCESTITTGVR